MIESQSTILNSQSAIPARTAPAAPVLAGLSWRQIVSWTTKGGLAIADQGLFAGSNFLLNVLLARWLAPADYGAFALAYSVFLLFGVFHTAILTEPMLVFGPGKYRERFPEYLGILLRGHFALMLPGAALLAAAALLLGWVYSPTVGRAFLALALAGPFILLLWLLRRAFYVRLNPGWSAVSGGVYLAILLASILALRPAGRLTPATGFLAMAAASLITCLVLFVLLRPKLATESSAMRAVAADHWRYGKWAAATAAPSWFSSNIYFLVLPAWFGLEAAGALKALINLAMPALHTISALGVLLLPILVRARDRGGPHTMKRTMKLSLAVFLSGSACYLALLWGFRLQIFQFLYAGKYAEYASWPLLLVGMAPIVASFPTVLGGALRALERPDWVLWSYCAACGFALVVGWPLSAASGVAGALAGLLLTSLALGIVSSGYYIRLLRNGGPNESSRYPLRR
jgi:O-antigen/teichoic acid export membrane protein